MPRLPPKPCRQPGCPALTEGRYCPAHAKEHAWESTTTSSTQRGYGARWQKLRRMILNRDPICRLCGRADSTDVDHVVPKSQGGDDSDANLQGVCDDCHQAKTVRERVRPPRGMRRS